MTEAQADKRDDTLVTEGRPPDLPALTGIRFFAAAWVVVFHFHQPTETAFPGYEALHPLTSTGGYGVDLFFILSGFVITYNYAATFTRPSAIGWFEFLGLRLTRMYPVHLATLLSVLLIATGAKITGGTVLSTWNTPDFLAQLLLVNAWRGDGYLNWNYPAWSISAEWFAYLLFPLLVLGAHKVRSYRLSVALAAVSLGVFAICLHYGIDFPLVRIVFEFLCGMFLVRVHYATRDRAGWDIAACLSLAAIPAAVWLLPLATQPYALIFTFGLLVLSLSHSSGALTGWLRTNSAQFWGRASYSLYMTHGIVELLGTRFVPIDATVGRDLSYRLSLLAAYVAVLLAATAAMYLLWEEPSRRFLSRRVRRTKHPV